MMMITEEKQFLYSSAFALYEAKRYDLCTEVFKKLCLESPLEAPFWRGLASSLQMQLKWKESLHAWGMCALLQDTDPLPHFHAAECFFSLGEKKDAKKALDQALKRISDSEEDLLEKITFFTTLLPAE
jgi:type III secretion system low calcium response chaperone LcrH/SycD